MVVNLTGGTGGTGITFRCDSCNKHLFYTYVQKNIFNPERTLSKNIEDEMRDFGYLLCVNCSVKVFKAFESESKSTLTPQLQPKCTSTN
jgi:hypothetical protein